MPADLRTPPASPTPLAVNEREAARMLGVSSRTLFDWRKKHRGPQFKREGSRILYAIAELHRWLRDEASGGPSEGGAQ